MKSTFILFLVIFVTVLSKIDSVLSLRECADELNNDQYIRVRLAEFDKKLEFAEVLEQFFKAFNGNDAQQMDKVLKLLESVQIEDDSFFASVNSVVKPVVRIQYN